MRKSLLTSLSVIFILSQMAAAEPILIDLSPPTPANAAIRATVLPGWGQVFNGQKAKGYVVAGGVLLTAGAAYYFYRKSEDTYQDYETRGARNDALYSDYETQSNQAMTASLVAAGIWLYSIVDAYVVARSQNQAQSSVRRQGVQLVSRPDSIEVVFQKRF